MQNLIIIGNSHAGRECYHLFRDMLEYDNILADTVRFAGFLSYNDYSGDLHGLENMFLGSVNKYAINPSDVFAIGIADTVIRQQVYEDMKKKEVRFFTLLSPFAHVSRDIQIGEANIIGFGCAFSCDIEIGNANYFNSSIVLGHDVSIGDYNFLGPGAMVLGSASIGTGNLFGARSIVLDKASVGDCNRIAPAAVVYKGCGNNRRMAGNPALYID